MASCICGGAPLLPQIGKRIVVTRPAYLEVTTLPDKQATLRLLAFPLFMSHTSTRDLKSYTGNCRYDSREVSRRVAGQRHRRQPLLHGAAWMRYFPLPGGYLRNTFQH